MAVASRSLSFSHSQWERANIDTAREKRGRRGDFFCFLLWLLSLSVLLLDLQSYIRYTVHYGVLYTWYYTAGCICVHTLGHVLCKVQYVVCDPHQANLLFFTTILCIIALSSPALNLTPAGGVKVDKQRWKEAWYGTVWTHSGSVIY